jgi:PleD family two-component response regulator
MRPKWICVTTWAAPAVGARHGRPHRAEARPSSTVFSRAEHDVGWAARGPHRTCRRGTRRDDTPNPPPREERGDAFLYDHLMILAAVDDLLFRSKIRATAKQVGVDVAFARTADEVLTQVREHKPTHAIFDLNSGKTDPVRVIGLLKAESSVRTIAFASHVHVDLIDAAKAAGADQVLPRSAFAAHLADILRSGQQS